MSAIDEALNVVNEVTKMFNVTPPKVVFGSFDNAFYDTATKTIYLPTWAGRDLLIRMAIHEAAHHVVNELRKQYSDFDEERFAQIFEDVFYSSRFKGYAWVEPCKVCGFPVVFYSGHDKAVCPKCYTTYTIKRYPSPSPSLGKAIGLAVLGAVTAYALTDYVLKKPEYRKFAEDPRKVTAAVTGLMGFLLGLIE